ncbi:hypothetical protein HAX54_040205 [Datura stramonium]|uniref:P-type ATPase A domain-containing protein n=1 Tax=Datura stramonium TaxID=4076 RepID=A0ABS8SJT4_DATST|nr:hypothetical protein [Datura stramonium]
MEDHEDMNGSTIDIEAQGSSPLLMNDELATSYNGLMRKSVLFLRSTGKFIEAGARIASLSRDSEAGGGQIQLDKTVEASPHDGDWRVSTVQSNNDHITIELKPHDQSTHQQRLQINKISGEIVKEKNLGSLHNFGGVKGVTEALSSDVDNGIHVGDISGRHKLLQFCLLALESMKKSRWKKQKHHKANMIQVIRGGNEVAISASDLVYGDIACVRKGHSVPAHGLFVSGEKLELFHLDDGLVSITTEQNPFLSPGSKVINGDARMIVTSVQPDKEAKKQDC